MSSHQWWRSSSDVEKVSKVPSPATQIRVVSYARSWCRKNQSFVQGIISLFVVLPVRIFVRCQNMWCWMCSWLFWVSDWDEEENVDIFPSFQRIWNVKFENVWDEGELAIHSGDLKISFFFFFLRFVKVVEIKTGHIHLWTQ